MQKFFLKEFVHEDEDCRYEILDFANGNVLFEGKAVDVPHALRELELVGCRLVVDYDHTTFVADVVTEG